MQKDSRRTVFFSLLFSLSVLFVFLDALLSSGDKQWYNDIHIVYPVARFWLHTGKMNLCRKRDFL